MAKFVGRAGRALRSAAGVGAGPAVDPLRQRARPGRSAGRRHKVSHQTEVATVWAGRGASPGQDRTVPGHRISPLRRSAASAAPSFRPAGAMGLQGPAEQNRTGMHLERELDLQGRTDDRGGDVVLPPRHRVGLACARVAQDATRSAGHRHISTAAPGEPVTCRPFAAPSTPWTASLSSIRRGCPISRIDGPPSSMKNRASVSMRMIAGLVLNGRNRGFSGSRGSAETTLPAPGRSPLSEPDRKQRALEVGALLGADAGHHVAQHAQVFGDGEAVGNGVVARGPRQRHTDPAHTFGRIADQAHRGARLFSGFDHRHKQGLRPDVEHLLDTGVGVVARPYDRMGPALRPRAIAPTRHAARSARARRRSPASQSRCRGKPGHPGVAQPDPEADLRLSGFQARFADVRRGAGMGTLLSRKRCRRARTGRSQPQFRCPAGIRSAR